ncbi:hypothetical protein EZS27_004102 [termite gut metagenome]|uniref:Uncharacterized protein n=1 Tax=termite gut metagenome TaxID=433724 RepID=A0A5J4SRP8_9ZZZZ
MHRLIQCLNEHSSDFPEWTDSDEKKEYDSLPVSLTDFNKWVGVTTTGGEYFMLAAGWIIREVWNDCVLARFKEPQKTDDITRAVCYEVMGRACGILAYSCLPEPIRKDIDNEMGKNHREKADVFIREHVAQKFIAKASVYWSKVDLDMDREQAAMLRKTTQQPIVGGDYSKENDKFFYL